MILISDPPYSVQKAYFIRQKAFIVNPNNDGGEIFNTESSEATSEFDNNDDEDLIGVINPRTKADDRLPRKLNSRSDNDDAASSEQRISQLLRRLLDRLRDRIS